MIYKDKKYGRLTVLCEPYSAKRCNETRPYVMVECDHDNPNQIPVTLEVKLRHLLIGNTQSCGCIHKEQFTQMSKDRAIHGLGTHPLYRIWHGMKSRCYNPKNNKYHHYGGRGITICQEWLDDFMNFYNWGKDKWQSNLILDRTNPNGNYEPLNCRFITEIESQNNKRNTHRVEAFDEIKTMAEWTRDERCRVSYQTLRARISYYDWQPEKAITTPSLKRNIHKL